MSRYVARGAATAGESPARRPLVLPRVARWEALQRSGPANNRGTGLRARFWDQKRDWDADIREGAMQCAGKRRGCYVQVTSVVSRARSGGVSGAVSGWPFRSGVFTESGTRCGRASSMERAFWCRLGRSRTTTLSRAQLHAHTLCAGGDTWPTLRRNLPDLAIRYPKQGLATGYRHSVGLGAVLGCLSNTGETPANSVSG